MEISRRSNNARATIEKAACDNRERSGINRERSSDNREPSCNNRVFDGNQEVSPPPPLPSEGGSPSPQPRSHHTHYFSLYQNGHLCHFGATFEAFSLAKTRDRRSNVLNYLDRIHASHGIWIVLAQHAPEAMAVKLVVEGKWPLSFSSNLLNKSCLEELLYLIGGEGIEKNGMAQYVMERMGSSGKNGS